MLGFPLFGQAAHLTPLAPVPQWKELDRYQKTITRKDFEKELNGVFAPYETWKPYIRFKEGYAEIKKSHKTWKGAWRLYFAKDEASARPVPRFWRTPLEVPAPSNKAKPLTGMRILLDPGHLGGEWSKMEERWYQLGDLKPVEEGNMVMLVAEKVKSQLEELGATVLLTRTGSDPATDQRPEDFEEAARARLKRRGIKNPKLTYSGAYESGKSNTVQWNQEMLFYRVHEIRSRAERVNRELKPDLALCLHFNAEPWGNPDEVTFTDINHFHILVNGTFMAGELKYDDIRFDMMKRLLQRIHEVELAAAIPIRDAMLKENGLPTYMYKKKNARVMDEEHYIWARNLIANRLFLCPVLFLEPYVMNSHEVHNRIQMGDYEGLRDVSGVQRKSIYREYADGLVQGVVDYVKSQRGQ